MGAIGLPHTIGLTVMGAIASLALVAVDGITPLSLIALALTLPVGELQATLLTATYVVVVFSVAVQGTTKWAFNAASGAGSFSALHGFEMFLLEAGCLPAADALAAAPDRYLRPFFDT